MKELIYIPIILTKSDMGLRSELIKMEFSGEEDKEKSENSHKA